MIEKLKISQNKILKGEEIKSTLARWRFAGEKIIFSNGCFDIIHPGHMEYLSKARDMGTKLIIGLNSDDSVQRLKGENRPVMNQNNRALMLACMHFIDAVIIFDEETPYELIKSIQPDILVKGADYNPEDIAGYDIVMDKGGSVKTIDLTEGFSTTAMIQKIKDL